MKVLLAAVVLLAPHFLQAAETAKGYDAFPLVRTRNIFDPNRKPPPKKDEQPRAATPSRPKSVHLSLTGTMVTESKRLAFFTGSRSEFNKVISVGEKIGDMKVTSISGAQVELDHAGKPTVLGVGKRLQLEGTEADAPETDPASPTPGSPASAPGTTSASSTPATTTAPAPAGSSNPSDVLKRMMERRAQEMKK
jgi:hypothetical protein